MNVRTPFRNESLVDWDSGRNRKWGFERFSQLGMGGRVELLCRCFHEELHKFQFLPQAGLLFGGAL